jgi:chemotaxis-related protein WspB
MMFLLFELGRDRYAIEAARIIEVLPLVELTRIPQAPPGVAGMFNFRGRPVPAVDLNELTLGRPARECLSTRIIVVNYPDENRRPHPLGLIAERATEIIRRDRGDFAQPGLKLGEAPYLGPALVDGQGIIRWVREDLLLPERVRDLLFCETAETLS